MTNNLEINGTIEIVQPLQHGTSKSGESWQKQDVIIETDGQYQKKICVNFFNKNVSNDLQPGAKIRVSINLESREYNGKWYTNVNAWKVLEIDTSHLAYQSKRIYEPPFQVQDSLDDINLPF